MEHGNKYKTIFTGEYIFLLKYDGCTHVRPLYNIVLGEITHTCSSLRVLPNTQTQVPKGFPVS